MHRNYKLIEISIHSVGKDDNKIQVEYNQCALLYWSVIFFFMTFARFMNTENFIVLADNSSVKKSMFPVKILNTEYGRVQEM